MESYWNLFIDEVCDGIESTESVGANAARGITDSRLKCREVRISAAQVVTPQEEIYDHQFELMETSGNVMARLTQIESSKIIGKGPRAPNPANLTLDTISMLLVVSSISYDIFQTTNVQNLCNIMEYTHGRRPALCNGLATNIVKLTATTDLCIAPNSNI